MNALVRRKLRVFLLGLLLALLPLIMLSVDAAFDLSLLGREEMRSGNAFGMGYMLYSIFVPFKWRCAAAGAVFLLGVVFVVWSFLPFRRRRNNDTMEGS